jgi:DNA repair exonuclease SbcCD ATPase subunit
MLLLELALIGVRGLTKPLRIHLKPGLNLIQGENGSGKTTVLDALFALLSPASDPSCFHQGQAGMIFRARDGKIYRLIRDFGLGTSNLALRNELGKFESVHESEEAVLKFLSGEHGNIKPSDLAALFCLKKTGMPSSFSILPRPLSEEPAVARTDRPAPSVAPPPEAGRAQTEKRLEELRAMLAKADSLNRMEDQVSELQSRSAELKRRVRLHQDKSRLLAGLDAEDSGMKSVWPLPPDHELLLAKYEQQIVVFSEQKRRIEEDRAEVEESLLLTPSQSIFQNRNFLIGSGITLLSFIVPLFILIEGVFQHLVPLGLVAGIAMMVLAASQDFRNTNKRKSIEAQIQDLTQQEEALENSFTTSAGPAQALLDRARCGNPDEFRGRVRDYERILSEKKDLEEEISRILQGKTAVELDLELSDLTAKMQTLESRIRSESGSTPDTRTIEEEIQALEREVARAEAAETPPGAGALHREIPAPSPDPTAPPSFSPLAESFRRLLSTPALGAVLPSRARSFQAELDRWMGRFPKTRSFRWSLDANLIPAPHTKEGNPARTNEWNSGLLDQAYLAFFFALSRIAQEIGDFPLLFDDPWGSLDAPHQEIALDILREIAQNKQVLLMSCRTYPVREDDGVLTLPAP